MYGSPIPQRHQGSPAFLTHLKETTIPNLYFFLNGITDRHLDKDPTMLYDSTSQTKLFSVQNYRQTDSKQTDYSKYSKGYHIIVWLKNVQKHFLKAAVILRHTSLQLLKIKKKREFLDQIITTTSIITSNRK